MNSLLRKCNILDLDSVDLKYIISQQLGGNNSYQCDSSQLKVFMIKDMGSLEEIMHGPYLSNIQQPCFTNLTNISITECPKLKRAFSLSVAREFTQLVSMQFGYCSEMEEVLFDDQVDTGNQNMEKRVEKVGEREADCVVVLPLLERLYLEEMPKLRVVYNGNDPIECPSLEELDIRSCNNMEDLSYGSFNSPGTKALQLDGVGNLSNIFKLEQENGILQLEELKISRCHEMKYLADAIACPNRLKALFSCLENLYVWDMDSLEEIWHGPYLSKIHAQCLSNLTEICMSDCPKVKHLFSLSVATELRQLQVMKIESCDEIEEIFYKDHVDDEIQNMEERVEKVGEREANRVVVLPRLKLLHLRELPELRVVYNGNEPFECPSLEQLEIRMCNKMRDLSYGSFNSPATKKLELKGVGHEMIYLQKTFFSCLENFHVQNMDGLEEIQHGRPYLSNIHAQCFSNLTEIYITDCPKVKRLFPLPVATALQQLQAMRIETCEEIEEIFYKDHVGDEIQVESNVQVNDAATFEAATIVNPNNDGKSPYVCPTPTSFFQCFLPKGKQPKQLPSNQIVDEIVKVVDERQVDLVTVFPQLKRILLEKLPELKVVYNGNNAISCPSLEDLRISECNGMKGISYGSFTASKSKKIYFKGARHLKCIPEWLALKQDNSLVKELEITKCRDMKYLVDPNLQKTFFSSLEVLKIWNMDSLKEIWHGSFLSNVQARSCFSHLTKIVIANCQELKHVFPLSVASELTQLQALWVVTCQAMDEIFYKDQVVDGDQTTMEENTAKLDGNEVDGAIIFPQLKFMTLEDLSKLRIVYDGNHAIEFPALKEFRINGCNELEPLSTGPFKAPNLENIKINGHEHSVSAEDVNLIVKKELYTYMTEPSLESLIAMREFELDMLRGWWLDSENNNE